MRIIGDMAIRDLTPEGTNIGNRIVKNMRICGSGIYTYHKTEAKLFGLDPEQFPGDGVMFNMYRPPEVIDKNKDMFARVPIITGSHVAVTPDNAKQLTVGMVGDSITSEVDPKDGELYLYTTGTIVAGDGIKAYEDYGQLSVGYVPEAKWESGVHNGVHYEAVLTNFKDVNHLLLCKEARGGPQCMVMDSIDHFSPLEKFISNVGGTKVNIFEKIFGDKKETLVGDERVPILLQSIAVGADPEVQVKAIRCITDQLVAGDAKTTFDGYLKELEVCKNEAPEVKAKAVEIVSKFFTDNFVGDSFPDKDDKKDKKEKPAGDAEKEDKSDKEKPAGDSEDCPKCKKSPCECSKDKNVGGDSNEVIIEALKTMNEKIESLSAKVSKPETPQEDNRAPLFRALIAGDSAEAAKKVTSSDFIKSLTGGK
jgi:hypothetical protein